MKYNLKNIISFLLINLLPQLSGFILLKVYTEHLAVEELGFYNTLMAIPPLLSVFASLQLHSSISRLYFDYNEPEKRVRLIGTILTLVLVASISLVSILFFFKTEFLLLLFGDKFNHYESAINFILLISVVTIGTSALNALLVVQELGQKIIKRVAAITLLQIVLIFLSVTIFEGKVIDILTIILFSSVINLLLVFIQTKYFFKFCIIFEYIPSIFHYSLPLVFHQLGGYLFNFSSVLILANQLSLREVALYTVLFKLASLKKIFVNSINTAWQPSAFKKLKEDRKQGEYYIKKSYVDFYCYTLIVYVVLIQLLSYIVENWINSDYKAITLLIPIMVGAYLFRLSYCFSTTLLFFDKKTHLIPIITTIAGLLNVVLVLIFITSLNFTAAIYSFISSMFFMAFFYSVFCKIYYRINYFRELFSSVLVIIFTTYVNTNYSFMWQNFIYVTFLLVGVLTMVRKGMISFNYLHKFYQRF
jgi:O-antigen/teichoic acid export membrane protein